MYLKRRAHTPGRSINDEQPVIVSGGSWRYAPPIYLSFALAYEFEMFG
jgi:hypothetical protein